MKQTVTVLGDGAWGTALATLLAHNGHQVNLWCYNSAVAQSISTRQENSFYLPGITLSSTIIATTDFKQAFTNTTAIFEAIPVKHMRSVLTACASYAPKNIPWVILSKGIEQKTLLLPSELIQEIIKPSPTCVVLAGPSFARDLAQQKTTACTIAGDKAVASQIQALVHTAYFTTEYSTDLKGVQLASAFKNCIALGVGLLEGAGYGDNTQALFLTLMIKELALLLEHNQADSQTMWKLAGIGDIVLTAYSNQSRNRALGQKLGAGNNLSICINKLSTVPESFNTLQSIIQLQSRDSLLLPLCTILYQCIFEHVPLAELVSSLTKCIRS